MFPSVDVQLTEAKSYATWALTVQYIVCALGLWGYVQGTLKYPPTHVSSSTKLSIETTTSSMTTSSSMTNSLVRDQWIRTDDKIMGYIMRFISIPTWLFI